MLARQPVRGVDQVEPGERCAIGVRSCRAPSAGCSLARGRCSHRPARCCPGSAFPPGAAVDLFGHGLVPLCCGQECWSIAWASLSVKPLRAALTVPLNVSHRPAAAVVEVFFQTREVLAFVLRLPHEVGELFGIGDAASVAPRPTATRRARCCCALVRLGMFGSAMCQCSLRDSLLSASSARCPLTHRHEHHLRPILRIEMCQS